MTKSVLKRGILTFAVAISVLGTQFTPAMAQVPAQLKKENNCTTNENINLTVNFNAQMIEVKEAVTFIDVKISEIEAIAEKSGVQGLKLNSKSLNINSNRNYNQYQMQGQEISPTAVNLSGKASFILGSDETISEFIAALQTKDFNINYRMNSNTQCR